MASEIEKFVEETVSADNPLKYSHLLPEVNALLLRLYESALQKVDSAKDYTETSSLGGEPCIELYNLRQAFTDFGVIFPPTEGAK